MEPAIRTVFRIALGVNTPVRPTCITISSTTVSAVSAGYLYATAQRGTETVSPRRSRISKEFTFTTAPSISFSNVGLKVPIRFISSFTCSMFVWIFLIGETAKPDFSRYSSVSECVLKVLSSMYCKLKTKISSFRLAAIVESSCLKEPAAALRGLAKGFSPFSSRCLFNSAKTFFGIYTSPRTTSRPVCSFSFRGMLFIVLKLSVTSSPYSPSPLVSPRTKIPF